MHTILIVDDVPEARLLIGKILEKKGFHVLHAGSGEEAIELVKKEDQISLVLLDIVLPDMDGIAVMAKIKPLQEEKGFKVCFVSGKKERDSVMKAIQSGGDDYLVKPIYPDALVAKIQLLLGMKDSQDMFNAVKCGFDAEILDSKIMPDIHVTEISEMTVKFRSTAKIATNHKIELDGKKLRYYLRTDRALPLIVTHCEKEAMGKYRITCRFVGLSEQQQNSIRAIAIQGKFLS